MRLELGQTDLSILIVECHYSGRDRVADGRIILEVVTPLTRVLELDDFEQGGEPHSHVYEDSEWTPSDHLSADRLPDTEPGSSCCPLRLFIGSPVVAEPFLEAADSTHLPCLRTEPSGSSG